MIFRKRYHLNFELLVMTVSEEVNELHLKELP